MSNGFPICRLCHDSLSGHHSLCHNCLSHRDRLGHLPVPVLALSLFDRQHPLRDALHAYKDETSPDFIPSQQALTVRLAQQLKPLIPTGVTLTTVPSTRRHNHLHDVATSAGLNPIHTLQPRYPRAERIADPNQFRTITGLTESPPLLVLEDAYVTGSTAQSAAHALIEAGATVTGIAAIGRRINPQYAPEHPIFNAAK